eukprot:TRINITY_DN56860_c0_g1_i1.p1 TRINITY_DN56860_c0_g1~~TRINITY_DN56860_c0_g1_i1.p1  ORF type:complete len:533 (-),score=67.86 TRINITY_DN56860_c0_g1_i1:84-1682(-)
MFSFRQVLAIASVWVTVLGARQELRNYEGWALDPLARLAESGNPEASPVIRIDLPVVRKLAENRAFFHALQPSTERLASARPALLLANLQGGGGMDTRMPTANFFVTTSRKDPYLIGAPPKDVPSCSGHLGEVNSYFGDADYLPKLAFNASFAGTTSECEVRPGDKAAQGSCEFNMAFWVSCPLMGVKADDDFADVHLMRKGEDSAVDFGVVRVRRPVEVPKTKVAACAVLEMASDEHHNTADQLEDWIAWHRMVGIDYFVLYGLVPPRISGQTHERTFPQDTKRENQTLAAALKKAMAEGDVHYVELPSRPFAPVGYAFHAFQPVQINDCLLRLRDNAKMVKLGDLDEFLHPLTPEMDAKAFADALESSVYPYVGVPDVRWRRSARELPESIYGGSLFADGTGTYWGTVPFDAHDAHPTCDYGKTLVLPKNVSFGLIHMEHSVFGEKPLMLQYDPLVPLLGLRPSAINHHFGGGGPTRATEVKDPDLLKPFKPCLEMARHRPIDEQRIRSCRMTAQEAFLARFGQNASKVT